MQFKEIRGKLGFGCMRLPLLDGKVDTELFSSMVDDFIKAGFNYFDTAHGYLDGMSEVAIRTSLVERYKRDEYVLADKLSYWGHKGEDDIIPFFENQLDICGVEYFDFYLMHALNRDRYAVYKEWDAFGKVKALKENGKIRHIGMSFHDTADILDLILTEQPDIEFVQLQINYLDYDDPNVQSNACYEIAAKHGKPVIVMEPVKGGALVNLPTAAKELFNSLGNGSYASYALRYASSFPNVFMVLSGMGNSDMVKDNLETMSPPAPLSKEELSVIEEVRNIIRKEKLIPCTGCRYCTEVCPKDIPIPAIFSSMNAHLSASLSRKDAKASLPSGASASECISCGACEKVCPQSIKIRECLASVVKEFKL